MTMTVSPRGSRATAPAARPAIPASIVVRGIAWVRQRLRLRRDAAKLLALSDHLLADLGVRRDQIGLVAPDACQSEHRSR